MRTLKRPSPEDAAPYYQGYIEQVSNDGEIVDLLAAQLDDELAFLASIPEDRGDFCYAPGKWTVKEVLGHMADAEWIFTYRALRFARGDTTPLPGMEQDEFVAGANFEQRTVASLTEELRNLRAANLVLFRSFDDEILERRGTASDCPFSVRAQLYILCGHVVHHVRVLKESYLSAD